MGISDKNSALSSEVTEVFSPSDFPEHPERLSKTIKRRLRILTEYLNIQKLPLQLFFAVGRQTANNIQITVSATD